MLVNEGDAESNGNSFSKDVGGGGVATKKPSDLTGTYPSINVRASFFQDFMRWPIRAANTTIAFLGKETKSQLEASHDRNLEGSTVLVRNAIEITGYTLLLIAAHTPHSLPVVLTCSEMFKRYWQMQRNATIKQIPAQFLQQVGNCFHDICEAIHPHHNR
jgi:hypothetical protein